MDDDVDAPSLASKLRGRPTDDAQMVIIKRRAICPQEALLSSLEPTSDGGNETHTVAEDYSRLFQEIHYMGATRAVVGPGLVVRELLFSGDFTRLCVSAPPSTALGSRSIMRGGFSGLLKATRNLVESAEAIDSSSCSGEECSSGVARRRVAVHLKSKLKLAPFLQALRKSGLSSKKLSIEKLSVKPRPPLQPPVVFQRTVITGSVSVSWPTGMATGAARLRFPSAGAANDFFLLCIDGLLNLPDNASVRLDGYKPSRSTSTTKERHAPLTPLPVTGHAPVDYVYDEHAIARTSASTVACYQYIVEITAGLPLTMNESELLAWLSPGPHVKAFIERKGAKLAKIPSDHVYREVQRVLCRCREDNGDTTHTVAKPLEWMDGKFQEASLHVMFTDFVLMARVHDAVATSLDSLESSGQTCQVTKMYWTRMHLPADLHKCFLEHISKVFVNAKSKGVTCSGESIIPKCTTHQVILLRSASVDALQTVVRALEDIFESELFRDRVVEAEMTTVAGRERLEKFMRTQAKHRERVCFRTNKVSHSVWVFGGQVARRGFWSSVVEVCLLYQQQAAQGLVAGGVPSREVRQCAACASQIPVEYSLIKLTACHHAFCWHCIQRYVTAAKAKTLCCPIAKCATSIHVGDIRKIVHNIDKLVRPAVLEYAKEHPDECFVCPRPGCSQILSRFNITMDVAIPTAKFTVCDSCEKTYCLSCSDASSQPIDFHPGVPCAFLNTEARCLTERVGGPISDREESGAR